MQQREAILKEIKGAVQEVVPDAKVILFGSRVTGNTHDESDWDILVLTKEKTEREIKRIIQDKLYKISLSIGAFISLILTTEYEWENHPGYYSLQLNIAEDYIPLMSRHDEAIKLKTEKAKALMAEVAMLLENKFYTTAISRIYYSCFTS